MPGQVWGWGQSSTPSLQRPRAGGAGESTSCLASGPLSCFSQSLRWQALIPPPPPAVQFQGWSYPSSFSLGALAVGSCLPPATGLWAPPPGSSHGAAALGFSRANLIGHHGQRAQKGAHGSGGGGKHQAQGAPSGAGEAARAKGTEKESCTLISLLSLQRRPYINK